ncbi:MAG: hypothetical protein PQJ59_04500 [Spirochaetales bacterium]|nr:hypothetical protein [Spirochaetales bacterium]
MSRIGRFIPLLFLLVFSLTAEEKDRKMTAFSLETRLYNEMYSFDEGGAYKWDVTLMPTVHFKAKGGMEFAPYLLGRFEIDSNEEEVVDTDIIDSDLYRISLGAGAGFYWNLIETKYFNFISGFSPEFQIMFPQWGGDSPTGEYNYDPAYGAFATMIDVPMALEFKPFEHLSFRMWVEMLRLGFRLDEEYYNDDQIERNLTFFSYSPFWNADWTAESSEDWIPYPTPISFSLIWSF